MRSAASGHFGEPQNFLKVNAKHEGPFPSRAAMPQTTHGPGAARSLVHGHGVPGTPRSRRDHVLETAQLFGDDFYPAHLQGFPRCTQARGVGFFPSSHFYT